MIKIVNSAGHGEIWIYGDVVDNFDGEILKQCGIGDAFVWPENIKNQLAELKGKPLDVYTRLLRLILTPGRPVLRL